MASGGLALVAAVAGDLESVKWAHLHACPISRVEGAGMLCHIAAARARLFPGVVEYEPLTFHAASHESNVQ